MPPPICANCNQTMKCSKNDVLVADDIVANSATYWHGDMYSCIKCGNKVIIGFGKSFTQRKDMQMPDLIFKAV